MHQCDIYSCIMSIKLLLFHNLICRLAMDHTKLTRRERRKLYKLNMQSAINLHGSELPIFKSEHPSFINVDSKASYRINNKNRRHNHIGKNIY